MDLEQKYTLSVQALKDYAQQAGFNEVVLGLSGGIDSALVAVMCVDAFGADRVHAYMSVSYTHLDVYKRQLIGYAGGWIVDGGVQILKVATDPRYRRLGIARSLIEQIALDARCV